MPSFLHTCGVRSPRPNSTSACRSCVTICSVLYRFRGILPPVVTPEFYLSGWFGFRGQVTTTGKLETFWSESEAIRWTLEVDGVETVVNELQTF